MDGQVFPHGGDRDPGGLATGEAELPGRDAAERDGAHAAGVSGLQAGAVARAEGRDVGVGDPGRDHRSHRVDDAVAGEVVSPGDDRSADGLPAPPHDPLALETELHPGICVDRVVDAPVAGDEASQHAAVRSVDYRPAAERGDVPLPQGDAVAVLQVVRVRHAATGEQPAQVVVLDAEDLLRCGQRAPDVHQGADERPSPGMVIRDRDPRPDVVGEPADQEPLLLFDGHVAHTDLRTAPDGHTDRQFPHLRQLTRSILNGTDEVSMQDCGQGSRHDPHPSQRSVIS